MRYLATFGRFWWDFIAGDDWRLAAGVLIALAVGALLTATSIASDAVVAMVATAGIVGAVAVALFTRAGPR